MATKLRAVDSTMTYVVAEALKNVALTDADKAAVELARRYAEVIDMADEPPEALKDFGPKLLAVLAELRATPRSRGLVKPAPARAGKLQALRSSRAS